MRKQKLMKIEKNSTTCTYPETVMEDNQTSLLGPNSEMQNTLNR